MIAQADRRRVSTSARVIGLWVGMSSAVVITLGIGVLVAIILSQSRPDSHSRVDGDDYRWLERVVVDVDDVVPWILGFGVITVVSLAIIAWAAARRAVTPLAEALSVQRAFVADASHELRTPLTALGSRVQILERRLARGEPIEPVVAELRRDTESMAEVLADLLLEAQLEANKLPQQPTDLRKPLEETIKRLAPLASERGVTIQTSYYAEQAPIVVPVSRVPLERLFLAILDNAIEHSPASAAVTVHLTVHPQHVEIRISDQGSGIAATDFERIFERFARGPETGRRRGYGLGLSLAHAIAEHSGGTLAVEATSPKGTTFLIRLPRSGAHVTP